MNAIGNILSLLEISKLHFFKYNFVVFNSKSFLINQFSVFPKKEAN